MTKLSQFSLEDLKTLQDSISDQVHKTGTLEEAAQTYTNMLQKQLHESVVLARFFATVLYGFLPPDIKDKVLIMATEAGIASEITDKSLILTLLGTTGKKERWCSRKESSGHTGIPLVSSTFIKQIPMMSRLLHELGAGLEWIDDGDTDMVIRTSGKSSGIFYVKQAGDETDSQGRKIISAQDFVQEEHIETVIGIGGGYLGTNTFFTTILFLNEEIDKELASKFMLQTNLFKTATMGIVYANKLFN